MTDEVFNTIKLINIAVSVPIYSDTLLSKGRVTSYLVIICKMITKEVLCCSTLRVRLIASFLSPTTHLSRSTIRSRLAFCLSLNDLVVESSLISRLIARSVLSSSGGYAVDDLGKALSMRSNNFSRSSRDFLSLIISMGAFRTA